MGGLSARPSAGRTGPAGTCWGQDPGSKMATVIPGPLRCCGPAGGGGEGARAGLGGRVCVCVRVCGSWGWGRWGVLGAVTVGRAAPGCEYVTTGLWQEPGPTRSSWKSGVCGELRVFLGFFSGKGGHVPPCDPRDWGEGETVWRR